MSLAAYYCQCVVHRQSIARWAGYGQQTDRQSRDSAAGDAVGGAARVSACSPVACAHLTGSGEQALDCWTTPRALARWLELAPVMVRACSSSRRQSRSRRSDCVVAVSRASHAGLLTGLACRAEHARGAQGALSGIYMQARRRRLDRVSSPRPPSARQAPKLNKGSPLPRQRTPSLLSRHERPHLLCVLGRRRRSRGTTTTKIGPTTTSSSTTTTTTTIFSPRPDLTPP